MEEQKKFIAVTGELQKVRARQIPGKKYLILPHRDITKYIHKRGITYHFGNDDPKVIQFADGLEIVFTCYMTDPETGRKSVAVGEANPSNLYNDIGKRFPAEIAANRAVDRAFIKLLGTDAKLYSDSEIEIEKTKMQNESVSIEASEDAQKQDDEMNAPSNVEPDEDFAPPFGGVKEPKNTADFISPLVRDDEVLLIGGCKGQKYGDVKGSIKMKEFISFLKKNNEIVFDSDAKNDQARRLRGEV